MTVRYSVTFEFPLRAPVTHTGTVAGGQPSTCVARATRKAQKALRPQGWSSMVCVLLERLDAETVNGLTPDAKLHQESAVSDRGAS